ncbi:MAG TPA: 50S ribosomal protein L25 [Candidatus Paceibacterota bacterium]
MLALEVKKRDAKESSDTLRKRGFMPAVIYGPKENSTAIAISAHEFDRLWKEAGETTVISLHGIGDEKETLIHDVQFHPVTDKPLHADFYVLEKGKKIKIKVPLVFAGVSPAEKAGHIIVKALHEIEIEVPPAQLPRDLPVEISMLAGVGDHITAGQIKIPGSATLITNANEIVASVIEFREEKIEVPVAAVEGAAPAAAAPAADGGEAAPAPADPGKAAKKEKAPGKSE